MKTRRPSRCLTIILGVVVVLLIVTSLIVPKGNEVLWLNGQHTQPLDFLFYNVTALGNGFIVLLIVIPALFQNFRFALTAASAFTVSGIMCAILKKTLHLSRPSSMLGSDLIHVVYDVTLHTKNSFPSGHTTTAFCVAAVLAYRIENKVMRLCLIAIALLVGLSRIYLGQHFLMDVAVGALLGSSTGLAACIIFETFPHPWLNRRLSISNPLQKSILGWSKVTRS